MVYGCQCLGFVTLSLPENLCSKKSIAEGFSHPQTFILFRFGSLERAREARSSAGHSMASYRQIRHQGRYNYDVIRVAKGLMRTQTFMHAIPHGGCTNTVRESAYKVGLGEEIPCCNGDSNPSQYCSWIFSRTLCQLSCWRPVLMTGRKPCYETALSGT